MIRVQRILSLIMLSFFSALFFFSCKNATLPSVTTGNVTRILQTNAYSGGNVYSDGGDMVTARGVCWNTSTDPTTANGKTTDSLGMGLFTSHLTGLTPNTMYYVRAYATNGEGTAYGDVVTFTTDEVALPEILTTGAKSVSPSSALGGGNITNDGGLEVTARGVCWSLNANPTVTDSHTTDGTGPGLFASTMTGLSINSTYHMRAYATNSLGTAYGSDIEFIHIEPVADIDGNYYSIVTIGTQIWMGENLRTTTLNDGTAISTVSNGQQWAVLDGPGYCWYNNMTDYKSSYGALYNWHAVNTGKLCPSGWHVPTDQDFNVLVAYLGGDKIAGGKMKESGTLHWAEPNTSGSNASGFAALPGGGRYNVYSEGGAFSDLTYYAYFWSSTESNESNAWSRDLGYNLQLVNRGEYSKQDGESIRCIKNP